MTRRYYKSFVLNLARVHGEYFELISYTINCNIENTKYHIWVMACLSIRNGPFSTDLISDVDRGLHTNLNIIVSVKMWYSKIFSLANAINFTHMIWFQHLFSWTPLHFSIYFHGLLSISAFIFMQHCYRNFNTLKTKLDAETYVIVNQIFGVPSYLPPPCCLVMSILMLTSCRWSPEGEGFSVFPCVFLIKANNHCILPSSSDFY